MSTSVEAQRSHLRYGAYGQGLTPGQLRTVIAMIVLIHVAVVWGLLQIPAVRDAVIEAAPMFFEVIAEPAPIPPTPPPQVKPVPKVITPAPLMTTPTPSATDFVVEPAQPEVPAELVEPSLRQSPPAPAASPPPAKMIPASSIQYLVQPQMEYPRASRPFRESGRVVTRVYVDEKGLPQVVQINKSSGFPRLDEAGIKAVQKARFKPYTENGQPTAGWALVSLNFEVE